MLKSILAVFSGAFGMILKVLLAIGSVIAAGYCLITLFTVDGWPDRLICIAGVAGLVLLFRWLIRPSQDV